MKPKEGAPMKDPTSPKLELELAPAVVEVDKRKGVDTDSSGKLKLIKLCCSEPNSSKKVEFEICEEKQNYEIIGLPTGDCYSIEKCNQDNDFLILKSFDYTLDSLLEEWLKEGKAVWCPTYKGWGELRPNEDLRKILRAMVLAVCRLHTKKQYHGALSFLENYAIKFVEENYAGDEDNDNVEVTLLYRRVSVSSVPVDVEKGIVNDISALRILIFDTILKVGNSSIPEDLRDLHSLMENCSRNDFLFMKMHRAFIANHTSLWPWLKRYHYLGKVCEGQEQWMHLQPTIWKAVNVVKSAKNWQAKIPANSPFENLLNAENTKPYTNDPIDLVRYVRAIINIMDGVTDQRYANGQYVEMKVREMFPLLFTHVYPELGMYQCFTE